jgi:hypothetical protein
MLIRSMIYSAIAPVAFLFATPRTTHAQMCGGYTTLVPHDTLDQVMTGEQLKALTVQSFDGIPLRPRQEPGGVVVYEYDLARTYDGRGVMSAIQPLSVGTSVATRYLCGEVGDMTLSFAGKVMHLLFDIRSNNTFYQIDAPRFQAGTFHLRSLECSRGEPPPLIDYAIRNPCRVSSDNWDGIEKDWVRYLIPENRSSGGIVRLASEECRRRGMVVLNSRTELDAEWKSYPELTAAAAYPPSIDFRWEVIVVLYQVGGGTYSFTSFRLDKRGDLTFVPPDPSPPPQDDRCHAWFRPFYRSGITSARGQRLPPAPSQP